MAAICEAHIALLSRVGDMLDECLDADGIHKQAAGHLLGSLPVSSWTPTASDISTISGWLLGDHDSPKLAAARRILENLNWFPGVLDVALHRKTAFALLRAWKHHSAKYQSSSVFSVSAKTAYNEFTNWCWERLLGLQYVDVAQPGRRPPPDEDAKDVVEAATAHIEAIIAGQITQRAALPQYVFAALMLTPFGSDAHAWVDPPQPAVALLKLLLYHQKESAVACILQQLIPTIAHGVSRPADFQYAFTPAFIGVIRDMVQRPEQGYMPLTLWWARKASNTSQLLSSVVACHLSAVPDALAAPLAECWMRVGAAQPMW
jgi:hypothetical protein